MTFGVSSSPCQRSFQREQFFHSPFWYLRNCRQGHAPVFISMSLAWLTLHDCWCHLLGLHRPENNNASQTKDYQSPVLLRQLGIIFKLYSFPQNFLRLNLLALNIDLLSDIKQYPQVAIHRGSAIDISTLKLNVRRLDSCKTSKRLRLASLFFFAKKARGFSLTSHYQELGDCTTFFPYTKLSELARLSS